jgi:F0F1-type ATP synthase assembly protein I
MKNLTFPAVGTSRWSFNESDCKNCFRVFEKQKQNKRNQRRSESFSCRIQIETLRHTLKSCVCVFVFIGWLVNGMRGAGALRA